MTALSCTLVRAPMVISPPSPRRTAPGQTDDSAPMVTDPITVASGWTNASGAMVGLGITECVDGHPRTVPSAKLQPRTGTFGGYAPQD